MADLFYNTFKEYLGDGTIDLDGHSLKVCLLTSSYTPAATHVGYADLSGEVANGNGYVTGGQALANVTWAANGGNAAQMVLDADNPQWTDATFTARYAVLYDDTATGDPLIKCFDFGADKTVSAGPFTLTFNAAGVLTLE